MSAAMDQRPHQGRTRSKSTFSFKSDKSHHSSRHSKQLEREHLKESPAEKRKNHLTNTTKANPNTAMNEVQPIAAALEKPTLQSLRSFTHTDVNGNIIAEPDLSNPTRPRWERPLDTIRSFEAAIDNEYKRRTTMKPDMTPDMSAYASRRSSYYGGHDQHRYSYAGGAYGNRQSVVRDNWENGHPAMGPGRARYGQRPQGEPTWNRYNNAQGVYPTPGYQQSRDTVDTGASSGSQSEPYSNDPSDNSSIERAPPVMKPDLAEQYGFNGFGGGPQFQGPILQEFGNGNRGPNGRPSESSNGTGGYPQQQYDHINHAPPVPAKTGISNNVTPIKLSGGQQAHGQANGNARPTLGNNGEKRKSWFKRRFSKD